MQSLNRSHRGQTGRSGKSPFEVATPSSGNSLRILEEGYLEGEGGSKYCDSPWKLLAEEGET